MPVKLPEVITPEFIAYLRETYLLKWNGLHGWSHWVRVWENGQRIAQQNSADQTVVALFAFTHDMARESDFGDHQHGPRAVIRIQDELQGRFIFLPDEQLSLLLEAVEKHTFGFTKAALTVQTCWDADRLDLARAGIKPNPKFLCTPHARDTEMLNWANARSTRWREDPDLDRF